MKRFKIAFVLGAAMLTLTLVACGGSTAPASDGATGGSSSAAEASSDADLSFLVGQWRGSVKTTGQTVYGNAGSTEQMLDIFFEEDGKVSVAPLEAHADLLTDSGTYEGNESEVTLHLSSRDITLTVASKSDMEADPTDFDIDGFDTIYFYYYG